MFQELRDYLQYCDLVGEKDNKQLNENLLNDRRKYERINKLAEFEVNAQIIKQLQIPVYSNANKFTGSVSITTYSIHRHFHAFQNIELFLAAKRYIQAVNFAPENGVAAM